MSFGLGVDRAHVVGEPRKATGPALTTASRSARPKTGLTLANQFGTTPNITIDNYDDPCVSATVQEFGGDPDGRRPGVVGGHGTTRTAVRRAPRAGEEAAMKKQQPLGMALPNRTLRDPTMRHSNLKMPKSLWLRLKAFALHRNEPMHAVVQRALTEFLDREDLHQ